MSTRQDEIRDAIQGFADHIKPAVDPNQASPGTAAVHNEYPPLQRAENGGFVFHVGDTLFGQGPVDPDKAHHAYMMSRSEPPMTQEMPTNRPNLNLLIGSVFFWVLAILPLYIARFLPDLQHHWFDAVGFFSLFLAAATTFMFAFEMRR